MDLSNLIKNIQTKNIIIIQIKAENYTSLFCQFLLENIKTNLSLNTELISCETPINNIISKLSINSLSSNYCYFLSDLNEFPENSKKILINLFQNYAGCNIILFFYKNEVITTNKKFFLLTLNKFYNFNDFKKLKFLYSDDKNSTNLKFFTELYKVKKSYKIEELCLLKQYNLILGKNKAEFIKIWLTKIIENNQYFSNLIELFFKKDATNFLTIWEKISYKYPTIYWLTFWSNKSFDAYCFIQNKQLKKNINFNPELPLDFLNTSWRNFNLKTFKNFHNELYYIDFNLKQKAQKFFFERLFFKFFNNQL